MAWVQVQRTLVNLDTGKAEATEDTFEHTVGDVLVRVVTDQGIEEHVLQPGEDFGVGVSDREPKGKEK